MYNPTMKLLNTCFGQMLPHTIHYSFHLLYLTASSFKSQEILLKKKKKTKSQLCPAGKSKDGVCHPHNPFQAGTCTSIFLTSYSKEGLRRDNELQWQMTKRRLLLVLRCVYASDFLVMGSSRTTRCRCEGQ